MSVDALAKAILDRRKFLGMSQVDLVRVSGLSDTTVRGLERAQPTARAPRMTTSSRIERALGWPVGTISDILNGQSAPAPELVEHPDVRTELAAIHQQVDALQEAFDNHFHDGIKET